MRLLVQVFAENLKNSRPSLVPGEVEEYSKFAMVIEEKNIQLCLFA